ncbi:dihydrolipoyl dehydrogenase [Terrilactibacillus laevilacticus]|uniref:Dihydrolipoyl dehydrogenase n=1 Tax=Terrilactibacillus laevilacticus TaxID=1380157 RepID=A0ABW5PV25_9BACI|nr:dihydrolipoyl dehydrogenase [Terrilactibacillus laevilacticus]
MTKNYDLVLLGGGTGGYVAAIRASQLGLKTAIVETEQLGGTCLHRGCIPTKALLRSAEVFATIKNSEKYGMLGHESVTFDIKKVFERKNKIVDKLHQGVKSLIKKGKIDFYNGYGRILGPSIFSPIAGAISVEYTDERDNDILIPKNVIIATGSRPKSLPGLVPDGENVLTSDDAVNLKSCPNRIIIVGGGVIGVEWASLFSDFGSEVTILEYADCLVPTEDRDISKELRRQLKKKGVQIVTSAKVKSDTLNVSDGVSIDAEVNHQDVTYQADKILLSVGRSPNTEDIGLSNTSIELDHGYIQTNQHYQTKESHIYAIGDVIGGLQLAHVASHEGIKAAQHIAGLEVDKLDDLLVPKCIYTRPEIASIGFTEDDAKSQFNIKIGKIPFAAIGKALVYGESDGFVKVIADKETDDILGVHMIGPHVTDLISEAALAKVLDASPWEISETIHPHPTLSEVFGEAGLAVDGKAIHF